MRGNVIETVMGAVVIVVAALFLVFAYKTSQLRAVSGYELSADFSRVDGIRQGSDVRIMALPGRLVVARKIPTPRHSRDHSDERRPGNPLCPRTP